MRSSFYVQNNKVPEVKRIIRELPSLRFEGNPLTFKDSTNFCLTGEVEYFNKLDILMEPEPENIPEPT